MGEPPVLSYEQTLGAERGRRPKWVLAVVAVYLLLLLLLLLSPIIMAWMNPGDERSVAIWVGGAVGLLTLAGLTLLLVPVRIARRRPLRRGHIMWPILGSGLMMGLLVFGAGLALVEWANFQDDTLAYVVIAAAGLTWIGWSIFFIVATWSTDPNSFSMTLHRKVIAGSAVELLVAVPAHVVVRQRDECCAGIYTGTAICLGSAIMVLAFGPSVLLLYWRRWQKIRN